VFFADLKSRPQLPSAYWRGDVERPRGVGNALISELLMKFHPQNFGLYNSRSHNTLVWLGLMEGGFESKFSADQYAQAQGMLSMIRQKMWTLKIGKTLEEESGDADFISVNEFLWFVDNNKDVIKESIMKTQLKTVEPKPMLGGKELELADNPLMLRLMAALRTKPFAILAGHSGTGKSRMVRKLAYMTCCDEKLRGGDKPGNFCMIQVKPNWHDSTDLLGYYSALSQRYETTEFVKFICKAYAYPHVPFFVCLDEMNLAPVEQYFAEYLSAIESAKDDNGIRTTDTLIAKDVYGTALDLGVESKNAADWIEAHGLTIPKNLFVVGTVNMDETTCQFSRKVLDRAMTLEMNAVNFETFGTTDHEPSFADTLKVDEVVKLLGGKAKAGGLTADQKSKLTVLTGALEFTPFVVAYRFANEYALYTESLALFNGGDEKVAFDHLVLMKILPRILGEREMVNSLFGDSSKGLKGLFGESGTKALSVVKMDEILQRKESYLSFWP
jgi:hypothetical protein